MSRFILAFQGPSSAKFSNPKIFQKRAVSSLKAQNQGIIYPQKLIQNFIISTQLPTINLDTFKNYTLKNHVHFKTSLLILKG
jgi:hypothetical protein